MPELGWREQYPNLAQLYEQMMARPSFRDSAPPAA
jgi:glutathione S-transferase